MQATQGNAWDRLTADLAELAGKDHREAPANMFALSVEHMHPASPPCWPRRLTRVYSHETREFIDQDRTIGALVRSLHKSGSRLFGAKALAARFEVSVTVIDRLIEFA